MDGKGRKRVLVEHGVRDECLGTGGLMFLTARPTPRDCKNIERVDLAALPVTK
jgi:hypothetical protein